MNLNMNMGLPPLSTVAIIIIVMPGKRLAHVAQAELLPSKSRGQNVSFTNLLMQQATPLSGRTTADASNALEVPVTELEIGLHQSRLLQICI